jgi:hypothetical protein
MKNNPLRGHNKRFKQNANNKTNSISCNKFAHLLFGAQIVEIISQTIGIIYTAGGKANNSVNYPAIPLL